MMTVTGKWGNSEDENAILETVKPSIFSSDEVVCAAGDIPVAPPLHFCVQFWLSVFRTVLNDPCLIKLSRNCYWEYYLPFHKKELRKLCLLSLLKQPEREQKQKWFEKLCFESIILATLPAWKWQR